MLTAIDGDINGGDGADKFRIKIWWEDEGGVVHVVYDNQLGAEDDANPSTEIVGGAIIIHK
jgi:hypothetical protein